MFNAADLIFKEFFASIFFSLIMAAELTAK